MVFTTWAWLGFVFLGGCSCRKERRATCITYFSTYNERPGRAGLQSDFFYFYIYILPRPLISSCVRIKILACYMYSSQPRLAPSSLHPSRASYVQSNRNSFLHLRRYIKFLHLFQQLHFCIHSPKQFMNFSPKLARPSRTVDRPVEQRDLSISCALKLFPSQSCMAHLLGEPVPRWHQACCAI